MDYRSPSLGSVSADQPRQEVEPRFVLENQHPALAALLSQFGPDLSTPLFDRRLVALNSPTDRHLRRPLQLLEQTADVVLVVADAELLLEDSSDAGRSKLGHGSRASARAKIRNQPLLLHRQSTITAWGGMGTQGIWTTPSCSREPLADGWLRDAKRIGDGPLRPATVLQAQRSHPPPLLPILICRECSVHTTFYGPKNLSTAQRSVEGPADVEVGDIDVPVLMRPQGLLEALPLAGWSPPSRSQFAGRLEHAVDTGGADGHDIGVEHHVRQPPIALLGIEVVEGDDGRLLPILQPEVAGDATVVLVGCPQPPAPAVELTAGQSQPSQEPPDRQLSAPRPAGDELDDRIPDGLGNPDAVQSSPSTFFSLICSSMSSERTSCLRWSFCSRSVIRRSLSSPARRERGSNAAAAFSKNSFCQR